MPRRECSVMEERLRFVARLLDGEGMSDVCRQFGLSRMPRHSPSIERRSATPMTARRTKLPFSASTST